MIPEKSCRQGGSSSKGIGIHHGQVGRELAQGWGTVAAVMFGWRGGAHACVPGGGG